MVFAAATVLPREARARYHRAMAWSFPRVGGGRRVWGRVCMLVCCLVLQAPAARLGEPDAEPTGGVFGQDTPPPGRLTCCRLTHDCCRHGGSPARYATGGGRHSLTARGTGGAALGWTIRPRWLALAGGGASGRA